MSLMKVLAKYQKILKRGLSSIIRYSMSNPININQTNTKKTNFFNKRQGKYVYALKLTLLLMPKINIGIQNAFIFLL